MSDDDTMAADQNPSETEQQEESRRRQYEQQQLQFQQQQYEQHMGQQQAQQQAHAQQQPTYGAPPHHAPHQYSEYSERQLTEGNRPPQAQPPQAQPPQAQPSQAQPQGMPNNHRSLRRNTSVPLEQLQRETMAAGRHFQEGGAQGGAEYNDHVEAPPPPHNQHHGSQQQVQLVNQQGQVQGQQGQGRQLAPVGEERSQRHGNDVDLMLEDYDGTYQIGQGAYGIVFRGIQKSTGDTVAIKKIPSNEAAPEGGVPCNVIREISLLRELEHPNVVRLLDVIQSSSAPTPGSGNGSLHLVFEYVAHDLKTFMDQHQISDDILERRGLPPPMVKNFMRQIFAGVGFCHTYRVLHRDLKPHNLLISANGTQLKLADFGLARLSALPNGPYTHEVVTLWYRAPELLLGANRYSASVDVWSTGCIFAEMATGYPLFPGRTDIDQLFKIFQRRGTPNNTIWPGVGRLPHFNGEFPKWPEHPITRFVSPEALGSTTASELLENILRYDPERRVACRQALNHPYFYDQ